MKLNLQFLVCCLMVLPGCGRIIDWGKQSIDQGTDVKSDVKMAKNYIRSSRVYNQFNLVGSFDSLWLADDIRYLYADLYAMKHGKTESQKKLTLRRQLEENNHFISFILLVPATTILGERDSLWSILLSVDGATFTPVELKKIELLPEYGYMFGKKMNRFKTAYIIRFNAKDIEDRTLITETTKTINLVFRTIEKEVIHSWSV